MFAKLSWVVVTWKTASRWDTSPCMKEIIAGTSHERGYVGRDVCDKGVGSCS